MKAARLGLTLVLCVTLMIPAVCFATEASCEHQHPADYSGYTARAVHHAFVCPLCGQTVEELHTLSEWKGDDTTHWRSCSVCGVEKVNGEWADEHYAPCTGDRTHCEECGLPFNGQNLSHGDFSTHYDESDHWYVCDACSEILGEKEAHFAYCTAPGICVDCQIPYSGSNIQHIGQQVRQSDATGHWLQCSSCSAVLQKEAHSFNCENPGVCTVCGLETGNTTAHPYARCTDQTHCAICHADYSGTEIRHNIDETWLYDADNHWQVCTDCGKQVYIVSHGASCVDYSHCRICGVPYSGDNTWHENIGSVSHDENRHWSYCTTCQQTVYEGPHYATCTNPTRCEECGVSYSGDEIIHGGTTLYHDDEKCWYDCSACGQTGLYTQSHYARCTDPAHCARCGASVQDDSVAHYNTVLRHDESKHWYDCPDCGLSIDEQAHSAVCSDPTHCAVCGADYGGEVKHLGKKTDVWQTDGNSHWHACDVCRQKLSEEPHYALCTDPTHCAICHAEYSGEIRHCSVSSLQHDSGEHWTGCGDCGAVFGQKEPHYALCTDPTHCAICHAEYSGEIRHAAEDRTHYVSDAAGHWHICTACSAALDEKAGHTSTCADPTHCAVCAAEYGGENAAHQALNVNEFDRNNRYCWNLCAACNAHVNEAQHTMQFIHLSRKATCEAAGEKLYRCTRCEYEETRSVSKTGHDYQLSQTVLPTTEAAGYDLYTCAKCQATQQRNPVPALPIAPEEPDVPEAPETPEDPDVPETPEEPETPNVPEEPETPEAPDDPEIASLIQTLISEQPAEQEQHQEPPVIEVKKAESGEKTLTVAAAPAQGGEQAPAPVAVALSPAALTQSEKGGVTKVEVTSEAGGMDVPVAALKERIQENETCTMSLTAKKELNEAEKQAVSAYTAASAACEVKLTKTGADGTTTDLTDAGASVRIAWAPGMAEAFVGVCVTNGQAVEFAARLVLDENGNPLYWELPYQGEGLYMMAQRAA